MRINEYNSLEDFIYEYEGPKRWSWEEGCDRTTYIGIEFSYNSHYYRMCREDPCPEEKRPILPDGRRALYRVVELICKKEHYPGSDYYDLIGWYYDLNEVLDKCYIQGRQFREVIMDDNTEILGQD